MVSDDILRDKNSDQNNVLFEELPTCPVKCQIIKPNARLELAKKKIQQTKKQKKPKKDKCESCKMVEKIRLPRLQ